MTVKTLRTTFPGRRLFFTYWLLLALSLDINVTKSRDFVLSIFVSYSKIPERPVHTRASCRFQCCGLGYSNHVWRLASSSREPHCRCLHREDNSEISLDNLWRNEWLSPWRSVDTRYWYVSQSVNILIMILKLHHLSDIDSEFCILICCP